MGWLLVMCQVQAEVLTEQFFVEQVLKHNLTVDSAQTAVDIAAAQKRSAEQFENPQVFLETTGLGSASGYSGGYWQQPYDNLVRVEQLIETAGKRQLRIDAAQWQLVQQQWAKQHRLNQLVRDAKKAYYRVVHAQMNVLIYDQIWLQPSDVQQANAKRRRSGEISLSEYRRTELEALKTKHELDSALLHLDTMKVQLAALLSHRLAWQSLSLEPNFPKRENITQHANDLLNKALQQRADVQSLQAASLRREQQLQLAEKQIMPNVLLAAQYQHNVSSAVVDSFGVGVGVQVPLWHGYEGQIAEQRAEKRALALLTNQQTLDIHTEIETALTIFKQRHQALSRYEKVTLTFAIQVHNTSLANYRQGNLTLLELIDAERNFRDALLTYNRLMLECESAWLDLTYATGDPLV